MGEQETTKRKIAILILLPLLFVGFLSVTQSQLIADTSIISMQGVDWSLKVDSVLASSIDSRNSPYMTSKSATEKELFLELASLEDCKSGVVQFKVDMVGLTAYKQLPLTEQEIAGGSFRPKNVENSFALFDSEGRKVAHIYGSKITDSKGVEIWLDQNLQDGLLTVILPKPELLEVLSFPLLLDPTFGYTSQGASNTGTGSVMTISQKEFLNVTTTQTLYAISIYGKLHASENGSCGIYTDTGVFIAQTSNMTGVSTTAAWRNFIFSTPVTLYAGYYFLSYASTVGYLYYDSSASQSVYVDSEFNPAQINGDVGIYTNMRFSIYGTYMEQSATPTTTPSPTPATTYGANIDEGSMDDTDWYVSILLLALIIINLVLLMLPFALVRFVFGILSLFLCMLALSYAIPLSPYLQTAGLLISALAMLFSVRARE